ncbi:hypothetical protein RP20_CCG021492 [Aedes albopictus]|nr:hypothetical protein RP20_CCG021492 [Aedes albopictus]
MCRRIDIMELQETTDCGAVYHGSRATQEAVWWRGLRRELFGFQDAIPISCDNRSALCLADKEIGYSPRTKHIDIRHHFVREKLNDGTIQLQHVGSDSQKADVLTKPVPIVKFVGAAKELGLVQIPD